MKKRYRILSIMSVAALLFAAPVLPGEVAHADALQISDSVVRVHLSSYGAPASLSMEAIGSHTIADNGAALSGKFTVSVSGGAIKITNGSATYSLDSDVTIAAADGSVANLIKINGNYSYPGDFRLLVKNGGLKIINALDYETYLMGVIPYEMSNSWQYEALKAQAVASRTFAYTAANSRNRAAQEHDVVNTTASQVYLGYNAAYKNCIAAVQATNGQMLTSPTGGLIYTFYSETNGGHTEYPIQAGVSLSNNAYLPYKDDPYDIELALTSSEYSAKLSVPKSFSASTLKTGTGTAYAMLRNKLASMNVDVSKLTGTVKVKSVALTTPNYSNPSRVYTGADITLALTDSAGNTSDRKLSFAPYITPSGNKRPFLNSELGLADKSKFMMLYLHENADSYLLASVRYGHAAGMSQIGAVQMAKQGKTYADILTFYYDVGSASKFLTKSWGDASGITASAPAAAAPAKTTYKYGTVSVASSSYLNVRSGPGTSYKSLGTLKNKASVTIISTSGSWHKIQYKSGTGYVNKAYVKLSSTAKAAAFKSFKGKVKLSSKNGTLNVRSGPGMSYKKVGSLKHGAKVTITGQSGSWYKLTYKGKTAYVNKQYLVKA